MTPQEFTERAWKYVLKRGKVRRVTLRLNRMSEDLLLMGPDDLSAQLVRKLELGKSLDEVLVAHVRAAYAKNQRINTRAFIQRIYSSEGTRVSGAISLVPSWPSMVCRLPPTATSKRPALSFQRRPQPSSTLTHSSL